jgi:hypothetical protein
MRRIWFAIQAVWIVAVLGYASDANPMNVVNELIPQRGGPLLMLAGEQLAWQRGGAIEIRNLSGPMRLSSVPVDGPTALGTRNGKPVAVVKQPHPRLLDLSAAQEIAAEYGSSFADPQRVYGDKDTLFVAQRGALEIYKVKGAVELAKRLVWKRDEDKTFCGNGGAVYFHDGNAYQRVGADGVATTFASSEPSPVHVACGARAGTLWATTVGELHALTLADGRATTTTRIKLDGIYHLAGAGDAVAVVTVAMKSGVYDKVTVAVIGSDGRTRWTANVPPPKVTVGWIAGSKTHVALVFGDQLHVWTDDGKPVAMPRPQQVQLIEHTVLRP